MKQAQDENPKDEEHGPQDMTPEHTIEGGEPIEPLHGDALNSNSNPFTGGGDKN